MRLSSCSLKMRDPDERRGEFGWKTGSQRVTTPYVPRHGISRPTGALFEESGCLGLQLKVGGKFHLKLNMGNRPIAKKYREGKMKRTLKRE